MPVNILGRPLFSIASSFDVRYVVHEDGIEAFVSAGAGTRLRCRWVARAAEGENGEEKTVVEESIEVTVGGYFFASCPLSLMVEPRLSCQLSTMFGELR
jgi:hypothetical protein